MPDGRVVGPERLEDQQEERFPIASERAEKKIASLGIDNRKIQSLLAAATRARTPKQAVRWMHEAASTWAAPMETVAACRRGCAHCCHIPVTILTSEARRLASASGRRFVQPEAGDFVTVADAIRPEDPVELPFAERHNGKPCPFLVGDNCSVYEARPLVCRTHINLDDDDLLCRVVPGRPAMVPYANSTAIQAACVSVLPLDDVFGDIRDFFPG